MTLHLIDIASYQRGIDLTKVKAAGFGLVNIKTSQGDHYTFSDAVGYARRAEQLGMGISCFHWLDNSASGAAQAAYCWRTLGAVVAAVGHPVALQVDNEDGPRPATWAITRDFVHAIADRMGHLPYMYTGDWWATSAGRASWDVASLTPWLMAAPNAGYPGSYPGDGASHWRAGYWGYDTLALMQYAVGPITGAGGGNISKTAIRDPNIWAALTAGTAGMAGEDDMANTWTQPLTQGTAGYAGQQRDTALAFAWQASNEAAAAAAAVLEIVKRIATDVADVDVDELAAIEAAAKAGAQAGTAAAADEFVARIIGGVQQHAGDFTPAQLEQVEQAVRSAFAGGLAPDQAAPTA